VTISGDSTLFVERQLFLGDILIGFYGFTRDVPDDLKKRICRIGAAVKF
jgi:hypothetical protein